MRWPTLQVHRRIMQGDVGEICGVFIDEAVEHTLTISPTVDHPAALQPAQMLGNRRRGPIHSTREFADRDLGVLRKGEDDADARLFGKGPEHIHGPLDRTIAPQVGCTLR